MANTDNEDIEITDQDCVVCLDTYEFHDDKCTNCGVEQISAIIEKDEEIKNLAFENNKMALKLISLGVSQEELDALCTGSEKVQKNNEDILINEGFYADNGVELIFVECEGLNDKEICTKADLLLEEGIYDAWRSFHGKRLFAEAYLIFKELGIQAYAIVKSDRECPEMANHVTMLENELYDSLNNIVYPSSLYEYYWTDPEKLTSGACKIVTFPDSEIFKGEEGDENNPFAYDSDAIFYILKEDGGEAEVSNTELVRSTIWHKISVGGKEYSYELYCGAIDEAKGEFSHVLLDNGESQYDIEVGDILESDLERIKKLVSNYIIDFLSLMVISVDGYYIDSKEQFSYTAAIGEAENYEGDDEIFYYFNSPENVLGKHDDFNIESFSFVNSDDITILSRDNKINLLINKDISSIMKNALNHDYSFLNSVLHGEGFVQYSNLTDERINLEFRDRGFVL